MRETSSSPTGSVAHGNHPSPVGDVEQNLQAIPESSRTRSVSGQFWIWAGANLAPINWVLGALGIQLGLSFADTVTVLVVGNLIGMALFGLFVLLGQRTGTTGMVLARAVFGRRGNYLPSAIQAVLVIGWCAVNTWIILDLVMALMGKLGLVDPAAANVGPKVVVAALIMGIQVTIAWFGYKAIAAFERWTVPPTLLVLIAMSAVAWFGMHIDWSYAGPAGHILHGAPRIAAMTGVMTVIGIGWGITWFTYAADYSRFVSRSVPRRKVYMASVFGQFLPVVWLGILGASLATKSGTADPGKLIVDNFGLLAIPVLFLVLHGPIATNILNIYTFSVAAQAMDIKIKRRALNVFVGVLALVGVVFFVMQESFANTLSTWLGALVAWVAAWGGIMLVHYFWVDKRKPVGVDRLFDPIGTKRLPVINWAGITALLVGIFSTWLFMYGVEPIMQGPIATAMGGIDLSWLAGGVVAAAVYAILGPRVHARYATDAVQGVAAADQPAGAVPVSEGVQALAPQVLAVDTVENGTLPGTALPDAPAELVND
ncbi:MULTISPECIES: cytosine permease [unclassified Arthrobacter]|uniref:purine-cytosine permease family protein n=1 Tax=unclassified Arthrobacter TaxID=235627 RepID=UPI00159EAFE7|nr:MULTISPECIES: cytosine permease [unclassified Arthrobacter]MCQ9164461.1 cytosine permease [Arthrobacter sp. STN4]NVN00467.1 cytosine permease [Arthrobacter sp. SDTb3-6]